MMGRFALHCSICFPKRFDIFLGFLTLLAFAFCRPVMAQEQNGWQLDSLRANPSVFQARCPAGL
jgi:hypothetical protein